MLAKRRQILQSSSNTLDVIHLGPHDLQRPEAETFIRDVFSRHYAARVSRFAPNLLVLREGGRRIAAAGWRSAASGSLFLERYLDQPIEHAIDGIAARGIQRDKIVEVGHLASTKPGGSVHVIITLAAHFNRMGFEWVVFTATRELIGIFRRMGLPLLALASADSTRLGDEAADWGNYYDTTPVVVAGRIRIGIERLDIRS